MPTPPLHALPDPLLLHGPAPTPPTPAEPARRRLCAGAAAALLTGCATRLPPEHPWPEVVPFSASTVLGRIPRGWREQVMRRDLPPTRYRLDAWHERSVLHAVADRSTSGLRCEIDVDLTATPWLEWSWRAESVDLRATVAHDELDDAPARLILAFGGDRSLLSLRDRMFFQLVEAVTGVVMPFATLMYVWDGRADVESVFANPRTDRIRYLVVESGAARARRWVGYRRNVVEDYRRVFGSEPGRVTSIGVMTDSDDLKASLETWYGDMRFTRDAG